MSAVGYSRLKKLMQGDNLMLKTQCFGIFAVLTRSDDFKVELITNGVLDIACAWRKPSPVKIVEAALAVGETRGGGNPALRRIYSTIRRMACRLARR